VQRFERRFAVTVDLCESAGVAQCIFDAGFAGASSGRGRGLDTDGVKGRVPPRNLSPILTRWFPPTPS